MLYFKKVIKCYSKTYCIRSIAFEVILSQWMAIIAYNGIVISESQGIHI